MRLHNSKINESKIFYNVNIEQFKVINSEVQKDFLEIFPFYNSSLEYKEKYNFVEIQDNPNPKDFRDETIYIHHQADFGTSYNLTKCKHRNFDFEVVLFNNNLYIDAGVYYFANYVSNELFKLFQYYLTPTHTFKVGDRLKYDYLTYKQWIDIHPDKKWSSHNYEIDKEDLEKIGIIV